jgi:hypothetical protein
MTETRFGTFDELVAGADGAVAAIARKLRSVILAVDPVAVEVVRLGDRAATYGVGPKKLSEAYVYVMPQRGQVNLGFFRGTSLDDPEGLLEGTGKAMRHVKVRSIEDADRSAVRDLLVAARVERRHGLD